MPFEVQWHDDSFDPESLQNDAAIDELLLSDDLLDLAEQLGDDALRLQSCYPAEHSARLSSAKSPAAAKPTGKRWVTVARMLASGAACLAIACFALSSVSGPFPSETNSVGMSPFDEEAFEESTGLLSNTEQVSTVGLQAADSHSSESHIDTLTPALMGIGNATGPQLEAFYDYLEDEDQTVRLSI